MPVKLKVECPCCGKRQDDLGRRNTCDRCGMQPLPSYDYCTDSAFHPEHVSGTHHERSERVRQGVARRIRRSRPESALAQRGKASRRLF